MNIEYYKNYESMSLTAANLIYKELLGTPNLLLCTASGSSPAGTYRNLVVKYRKRPSDFKHLRVIKLDEWGGIPLSNQHSCESYLQDKLLGPIGIDPERYISFDSNSEDREKECKRVASCLQDNGPIDCCVLGLGLNGHIAFNEPCNKLNPFCHIAELSETSLQHPMAKKMRVEPTYGLSLGMTDILQSRKIIILITGSNKNQIIKRFFSVRISTNLPASFLWLHPNVTCLVDSQTINIEV